MPKKFELVLLVDYRQVKAVLGTAAQPSIPARLRVAIEISVRSQCLYSLIAMVPSKTELKLNMLTSERNADSQLRCDFDMAILSYMSKERKSRSSH
jgi:hypothetical protein